MGPNRLLSLANLKFICGIVGIALLVLFLHVHLFVNHSFGEPNSAYKSIVNYSWSQYSSYCLLTSVTPAENNQQSQTIRNFQQYANYHGYTLYVAESSNTSVQFSSKANLILDHFDKCKWILWIDSDCLIIKPLVRLEDLADDSFDVIATNNSVVSSSVMIFKSSEWTKSVLQNDSLTENWPGLVESSAEHISLVPPGKLYSPPIYSKEWTAYDTEFAIKLDSLCLQNENCTKKWVELARNTLYPSQSKWAFATILTNDNKSSEGSWYVEGALVAIYSLKKLSNFPFIVLVTPDVSQETRNRLTTIGASVREVSKLSATRPINSQRFRDTFTKLHLWSQVDFDKIVFMDADFLPLKNLDQLFTCSNFCAVRDSGMHLSHYFNAGLMVLKPDSKSFIDLVQRFENSNYTHYGQADQDLLNSHFEGQWERLPASYNPVHEKDSGKISLLHNLHHKFWNSDNLDMAAMWKTARERMYAEYDGALEVQ